MRKRQIVLYLSIFFIAILAMLGIAFGIRQAIRAGNLAGIDWYNIYDKEFVITTEKELYDLVTLSDYYDFAGQTIKLGADIVVNEGNAEDWHEKAPSKKWQPITEFAGTFDGQGHSISGLYGKSSSMSMGLFSETKKGCVIKDFKLLNSFFSNTTNNGVGSIMGEGTGEIQRVYSNAIIYGEGESNGGIAGLIKNQLKLTECWFDGTVIGVQRSNGGMIGWVDRKSNVTIDNCLNSGLIQFIGEGNAKTGGFVGGISDIAYRTDVSEVTITNSLTTGKIDVTNTTMTGVAVGTVRQIGALTLENSYAVVEVTDDAATEVTIGSVNGKLTGNAVPRYRETLIGVGGYQWTNLDFDKYWSCVEGDTPILKYFAEEELSLDGVAKMVDTNWYKKGKKEFVIKNAAEFWGFAMLSANTNFEGVTIKLGADITINDSEQNTWKEKIPAYNWFPIYSFSGVFEGQGHTISGVYCYSNGKRMGLFQQVNANGSIGNFNLVNSYIRGSYCVGGVIAHGGGNISNIYTDVVVENTGEHTGGILGAMNQNGTLSNCWFDGVVYGGTSYTGGITSGAMSRMCVITHTLNTGTVYGGTNHSTGGIVGLVNNTLTLSDSLNAGKVDDTKSSNKGRTGSVIGRILDSTEKQTVTTNIINTYTTRESYETSIGQGYPKSGSPFVNRLAELKGNGGYQRTLLNFDKYWAIDKNSHPTLQTFADEIPALPNVKRPYIADTSWFDDDETVFVLNTPEQLYGFAQIAGKNDFEGKTVKLGKNISLNTGSAAGWGASAPLNQWASIHSFNGTFDGAGHTVSGLYINDGLWRIGLFGNITKNATIKNVKVTNSYFEGAYHVGSIAGWLMNSTVQGVYSDANVVVRKGHGGGIVGSCVNTTVDNAWFAGNVSGDCNYIGGIASFVSLTSKDKNTGSVLSNCLNTGVITGANNVGGIVGRVAAKATIKYSMNAGTVNGPKNAGSIIGVVVADENTACNIAEGVYATKESTKKTVGSGTANGAAIVNTAAELTGVGGYQRTILDFNKYWSIVETGTPILKKFGGTPIAIPNVARATAPDTSWYNAKKNTYILTDYADLYGFSVLSGSNNFAGKTIKLGGNIVANSGSAEDFKNNTPLNQLVPVSNFAGVFDGQGYTISGLSANYENAWYVGVFGKTAEGAVIKNTNVENSYLTGEYHIGSVVGQGKGITIENIYSDVTLEASSGHVGGIIGSINGGSVSNCWFDGKVTAAKDYAGGITSYVGDRQTVTISHCLNTAPIKAVNQAAGIVGRVGNDSKLNLSDSLNTAQISGKGASGSVVGRIMETATVTFNAAYGTKESAGNVAANKTYSGDAQLISEMYLEGQSGYTLTNLDFNKYWTALDGATPQLSYFSNKITAEKVSLKGVEHMDTSWYDAKKNTYVLNDRADLYGFTYLVNGGNTFKGKTVSLGKNIKVNDGDAKNWADGEEPLYKWMPIGSYVAHASYEKSFMGTFDGKMHSISGLYTKNTGAANKMINWCAGLFARTGKGATVKNVEVWNSYFESPYYNGVVGHATGTTIDTVYTDAIVNTTSGNGGGIVGAAGNSNINNVWFDGSLTNKGQFTGGIVGVVNDRVTVSNCLTTGTLKSTTKSSNNYIGGLVGGVNGTALVTDSMSVPKSISTVQSYCVGSVIGGVSKNAKASATNTYTLGSISKLTIGEQVKAEEIGAAVNRISSCADLTGLNGYSLTKLDFAHYWVALAGKTPELMSFSDGAVLAVDTSFRSSTKWYTEAQADAQGNEPGTEENPYVILNKIDLYGFAELVNGGTIFAGEHVRLGADIVVNVSDASKWADKAPDYVWEPIGSYVNHNDYSKSFKGIFDGQDPDTGDIYSISGLYTKKTGKNNDMNNWCAGLFGKTAEGAIVKNVKVENSYFESAYYNGVIGYATRTTIENIYTDAIINTTSGNSGGIVGMLAGGSIDNAWFAGTITSAGQFIGGIAGLGSADASINNCLATGTVKSTYTSANVYAGGLVGGATGNMSLTNSLSATKEVSASGKRTGAAFGSANAGTVTITLDEVYVIAGIHKYAIGESATGTYTEQPKVMQTLNGYNGYTLTKLDFDNTWVAVEGTTPELKVFSEKAALHVADSFRPDTTWTGAGTEADPYVISTKAELYGLAELVNEGTSFAGKYIVLGADITVNDGNAADWEESALIYSWIPIGSRPLGTTFAGNFDGNGHTISGIYAFLSQDGVGLFGQIADGSVVRNFRITNSYFSGNSGVASVCGWYAGGTIDTIYSDAYVNASADHAAGIVGLVSAGTIVRNCWYNGTLTSKKSYVGGITSYVDRANISIESCLATGSLTGLSEIGGIIGRVNASTTVKDSLSDVTITATNGSKRIGAIAGWPSGGTLTLNNVYAVGASTVLCPKEATGTTAPGTVAGNGKGIDNLIGDAAFLSTALDFQNYWVMMKDSIPVLRSFIDANDEDTIDVSAWYTDAQGTESDPYVIETAVELYDLAKKVNASTDGFAGKYIVLGADITVNTGEAENYETTAPAYNWTPIGLYFVDNGNSTKAFKGNFDGQGHSISGLYTKYTASGKAEWGAGLFGKLDGAVVKNVKVLNSYFQASNYAGVIGAVQNGTLDSIYTDAIIKTTGSSAGGFTGAIYGGTINNCQFDGNVTNAGQYTAGIAGVANGTSGAISMTNCLVTGTVSTTRGSNNLHIGGLVGIMQSNVEFKNCFVAAKAITSVNNLNGCMGSVIGSIQSGQTATIVNVYGLSTLCGGKAFGSNGTATANPNVTSDFVGANGYKNTLLPFDRPETTDVVEGYWVAVKESTPGLKSFTDAEDVYDITGLFNADTTWVNSPVVQNINGVDTKTYTIERPEQLLGLATIVNAGTKDFAKEVIYLGTDITINTGTVDEWKNNSYAGLQAWTPIAKQSSGKYFAGTFDGQGHTISGLYCTEGTGSAMFGQTQVGSKVANFRLVNSYFTGNQGIASIGGWYCYGTFESIYSNATIYNSSTGTYHGYYGGIIGLAGNGANTCTIRNCWYDGSITANRPYMGGIVGSVNGTGVVIEDCLSTASLRGTYDIGGLVGRTNTNCTIKDSLSVATLSSSSNSTWKAAIVGRTKAGAVTCKNVYTLGASTVLYKADGGTFEGATGIDNLTGVNGYKNTKLTFGDNGYWVATETTPVLKSFVDLWDAKEIDIKNVSR